MMKIILSLILTISLYAQTAEEMYDLKAYKTELLKDMLKIVRTHPKYGKYVLKLAEGVYMSNYIYEVDMISIIYLELKVEILNKGHISE